MPDLANMTAEKAQTATRTQTIAQQNDRFRRSMCGMLDHPDDKGLAIPSGRLAWTAGISALDDVFFCHLLRAVATFNDFNEDNDPYETHEFAALDVTVQGQSGPIKIFWKIDAYDPDYHYGSEDPADPEITNRVLTLMLPSEY